MDTNPDCMMCEKLSMTLETRTPVATLLELPNTFDPVSKQYHWKHHDLMTYALIPRSVHETTANVDIYVCMDEDDLDDLDLTEYTEQFLRDAVFGSWQNFKDARFIQPHLSPPEGIGCWKMRHETPEEQP